MCGWECEELQDGRCDIVEEYLEQEFNSLTYNQLAYIKDWYPNKKRCLEDIIQSKILSSKRRLSHSMLMEALSMASSTEEAEHKINYHSVVRLIRIVFSDGRWRYYMAYGTICEGCFLSNRYYVLQEDKTARFKGIPIEEVFNLLFEEKLEGGFNRL